MSLWTKFFHGAGTAFLFASLVCAQSGPDGHWEGSFTANNREIGLSLDLAKNAKSEWIASMGFPSEQVTGMVVSNVVVHGTSIKFTAVELRMAEFDLTLGGDGKMKGTIANPQGGLPVEFKRTREAKVELISAGPAVSKEMEGDWEGSFQTSTREFRFVFHFKNQPDNTVAATFDGPGNYAGLPLNDVKQTGEKVEFGMKIAHGNFQGTINKEGTEVAGKFSHESDSVPMTLHKK